MRSIKKVSKAVRDDIGDLKTYRAIPNESIAMIDPFLFLNHHGPMIYPKNNRGLPFAPHPHRGFETATFIIEGEIAHRDSAGHESVIHKGGVQWMTAGKGLIHEEISSKEFKKTGGPLEILQLWVNLPSKLKMTDPSYKGLEKDGIKFLIEESSTIELVSGKYKSEKGSFENLTDITTMILTVDKTGTINLRIPVDENIFFYVIRGKIEVNGASVDATSTIEFINDHEELRISAVEESKILLCHGKPLNEPVVSYGPFVMNTREEINQAVRDYQAGKLG